MDIPEKINPTLVIDAIFGVGLSRDVTGEYADMLCRMNELSGEKAAVDIASGISADTGAILGHSVSCRSYDHICICKIRQYPLAGK